MLYLSREYQLEQDYANATLPVNVYIMVVIIINNLCCSFSK